MSAVEADTAARCLWLDEDGLVVYCNFRSPTYCEFKIMIKSKLIKGWRHTIKRESSIRFINDKGSDDSKHLFKLLWSRDKTLYCDYIEVSRDGTAAVTTEEIMTVAFTISTFYVMWSQGIICLWEKISGNLHLFNTGHNRYLGYLTLYSSACSSASLLRFIDETMSLWAIVRKYDETTKTSSAFLNTYLLPDFILLTTTMLPKGFSQYYFGKESYVTVSKPANFSNVAATNLSSSQLCCSCDMSNRSIIQWYFSPKKPWKEIKLNHRLDMSPELGLDEDIEPTSYIQKQLSMVDFQPAAPVLELQNAFFQ
ncbi:hypothetical protein HG535_0A06910 [Zygotorulaspora mrakii]|uniref:Uncharacterized protein n=1 Tax=Zygotorulaspora mrakii TaxID=42260 RepID=A0A7H9AY97_ZYGMR|nr:uncharacterized protein HG535_0A06910 [Zygotorulaspora mrakii]QLG70749.1 hypothetical protein HG535_0A06910 [Zygotorulaspora mrakii]